MSDENLDPEIPEINEELIERMNLTEALLFASPEPQGYQKISRFLGKATKKDIEEVVALLNEKYTEGGHCFRIREIAEGYQICLLPNMTMAVEKYFRKQRERRLTQAGLETLAIVAYKQPVTKNEIEHIRGVGADGAISTLLERKLITITGRSDKVGHPLLYGTTKKFLEYFGLKNLKELPRLDEFKDTLAAKNGLNQQELELNKQNAPEEPEDIESPEMDDDIIDYEDDDLRTKVVLKRSEAEFVEPEDDNIDSDDDMAEFSEEEEQVTSEYVDETE